MTTSPRDFLDIAGREASRYGGASIVFLRELLQNARDAGAGRIEITTEEQDGLERIRVRDDGRGMDLEHARRFLLRLYASSKRETVGSAGRFGVGFWSILRFEPSEITVCSRYADDAQGWKMIFDSGLRVRGHRPYRMPTGTVVELTRPKRNTDLGRSAWELVRRDARHLRMKDDPERLINVTVNGRQATENIEPGSPGLSFRRKGLRGSVSLGKVPEVTILAHGLKVRSAATIEDLLLRPERERPRSRRTPGSGLSPRVVVDSDRLAVLMDRGDVAQDQALVAVARVIREEIRRLCKKELDRLAPRSIWRKFWDVLAARRALVGSCLLAFVGVAFGYWGITGIKEKGIQLSLPGTQIARNSAPEAYIDRSSSYGGPVTGSMDGVGVAPRLVYRPPDARPLLAAFRIIGLDEEGKPLTNESPLQSAGACEADPDSTVEIELDFIANSSILRLPVPTGHGVDGNSVVLNGQAVALHLTGNDEPVLRLDGETAGHLLYRTAECPAERRAEGRWPTLPPEVSELSVAMRDLPPSRRVDEAISLVRSFLVSSGSLDGRSSLDDLPDGFFGSVFKNGGGDCDVVNSVLSAVLDEAGLPARMAVGWIGAGGVPMPGLHAWVEVDLGEGRWVAADATIPSRRGTAVLHSGGSGKAETARRHTGSPFWRLGWVGLVGGAVLILGAAFAFRRFSARREFHGGVDLETGPLFESLVRDRESWPGFAEARRRRLVPALGSDRLSLAAIEEAASHKTLFVAESGGPWVGRVKGPVLDGSSRAGRIASRTFGAFNLDHWGDQWEGARPRAFGAEIQEALGRVGLATEIRFVEGGLEGIGSALRVDDGKKVLVLIDEAHPEWMVAPNPEDGRKSEAIFRAADVIVQLHPEPGPAAEKAMAELARWVLVDSVGRMP